MRMPVMDGAFLLRPVKDRHPAAVRIVLSGHTEIEGALRAVPVAHGDILDPLDIGYLEALGVVHCLPEWRARTRQRPRSRAKSPRP